MLFGDCFFLGGCFQAVKKVGGCGYLNALELAPLVNQSTTSLGLAQK